MGLQLTASMGWPSDGVKLRKLFMVDFMPLKSKMRTVLSRLPDSRREPLWSMSRLETAFPCPVSMITSTFVRV